MYTMGCADTDAVAESLLALARMELGANSMRLLLLLLAKSMTTGTDSWSYPVDYFADQLGTHRNTVTRSFVHLVDQGLVRRIAGNHRCSPTRTQLLWSTFSCAQSVASADGHPHLLDAAGTPSKHHDLPSESVAPKSDPGATELKVGHGHGRDGKEKRYTIRDFKAIQSILSSLPQEAKDLLSKATLACDPSLFVVDAEWNLSEEQRVVALQAIPDKRRDTPPPLSTSHHQPLPSHTGYAENIIRIGVLADLKRAFDCLDGDNLTKAHIVDEIAFSVCNGKLGHGDPVAGVNAGLCLVKNGRWSKPRNITPDWYGSTERAVGLATVQ